MTDRFTITPLPRLLQIVLNQLDRTGRLFGIPQELFFSPKKSDPFRSERFGRLLETPVGVAAGPHTQLSQNILAAWLTGARFIELKTVQTLDELEVSKPCIDMQDEGYNCEWSQELKIHESFDQYLDAWILIHILKDKFGWNDHNQAGVIFNMSVGYDYKGILNDNIQWFFKKMSNAAEEIETKIKSLKHIYPQAADLKINPCISDNITLSTMHGCPPDEIGKIGKYLIGEKKLHTAIKLNPTLLGKEELLHILFNSGFETSVPDIAFEHDLNFNDAQRIIEDLQQYAEANSRHFSLKLTNTLECLNHKEVFPTKEEMMYMSGRVLHPISIKLAQKLQQTFDGKLDISFCAGVDAFNVSDTIACVLSPVTVCSDILKPGGYGRLHQYVQELSAAMKDCQAKSIEEFIEGKNGEPENPVLSNLEIYSHKTLNDDRYKKTEFIDPFIKTDRPLNYFDCIKAPCIDACPTNQDIPEYLHLTAIGEYDQALAVIMKTNPFPRMTGMVCDHLCQTKCTRINYDSPVLIREIKRFVAENGNGKDNFQPEINAAKAAIIGAGPSGLSCAYFLRRAGFKVDVYENKPHPGGMVSGAIPSFRLTDEAIAADIDKIEKPGVAVHYGYNIDSAVFEKLRNENDIVYIATGAQRSVELLIDGIDAKRVMDPLRFLFKTKEGKPTGIGEQVAIIGGGNTAMDAARTAFRLVGENGKVTVIYRRTKKQMPADSGEIKAVLEEGMEILELTSPLKINTENGKVSSVTCCRMKLEGKDENGRPKPVRIAGSEFDFECDTVIPAIGQELSIDFSTKELLKTKPDSYETQIPNVFIGGDAMRGASTAINAIGDGRKAAMEIIRNSETAISKQLGQRRKKLDLKTHLLNRSKRTFSIKPKESLISDRKNFHLVSTTFSKEEAVKESSRCLLCDEICNICTTVCPNLALHFYQTQPSGFNFEKVKEQTGDMLTEGPVLELKQEIQILHIADWCNECGNCTTFCPTSGSPYKDKPHLYINRDSFDKEKDGYYFERKNGSQLLHHKNGNQNSILVKNNGNFEFSKEDRRIGFDDRFRIVDYTKSNRYPYSPELKEAAEMKIIMEGADSFYG